MTSWRQLLKQSISKDSSVYDSGIDARIINRELSWLDFNARVLSLAADTEIELLERCKFSAIFCSNLDEFYQIRVAALKDFDHLLQVHVQARGAQAQQRLLIADATTRIHVELVKVLHVGTVACGRSHIFWHGAQLGAKLGRLLTRAPKRSREAEILRVLPQDGRHGLRPSKRFSLESRSAFISFLMNTTFITPH
jgi:hypothetical protein